MGKVYLTSEENLKKCSYLNDNVGAEYIKPATETAQDITLQELIGTKLYERICSMVADGSIAENIQYKALLDEYIIPMINHKVMAEITLPIAYKTRNLGIVNTNDTYAVNSTMKDAQTMAQFYENRAQFYANRLTRYLCANHNVYPEYCRADEGEIRARNNENLVSGIFLG